MKDSDLENSHPSKKAKKKESPIKKEKKNNGIRILLDEKQMFTKVITLYNHWVEQTTKKCVRSMDIPLKMGFYILQKFHSERMVIDVKGKELKVTTKSLHDMLGIPTGGTILTRLDQWPKDDTSYDKWKQQFKEGAIIRLNAIKKVIVCTTKADFNFKLNFLVIFCQHIFGKMMFPLSYISRKTDINNIDWCSYVLDCLVRTKNSYIPYSDTSYFVGPSAFLVLFYADKIHSEALMVTRKHPTICYWSSENIIYREAFEQEKGRFGLGELNEEFVNEQDEGDTDLEDNESDKDEDDSVGINSFERMKEKLNSKLNDAITKIPEKEIFRIFKEKMTNIIVEEKTKSTTFFEFPSNETGVESINLTPVMGQKTNDEKENEDKEVNGEEDNDSDGSQPELDYFLDSNEAENEGIKNDGDNNKKEGETKGLDESEASDSSNRNKGLDPEKEEESLGIQEEASRSRVCVVFPAHLRYKVYTLYVHILDPFME
uniref:Uncharacterized protein n=1 Tax=Lactuca sativa TaxID=4236 RepID=A0A9R1VFA4_LACSA|nr:hypothetical protein LSAT_V11C500271640 [Lactuca sativa]